MNKKVTWQKRCGAKEAAQRKRFKYRRYQWNRDHKSPVKRYILLAWWDMEDDSIDFMKSALHGETELLNILIGLDNVR